MSFTLVVYLIRNNLAECKFGGNKNGWISFYNLAVFSISLIDGVLNIQPATLSAWFVGLLLDVNIDLGMDLFFRIILPILSMGLCILNSIIKIKTD